MSRGSHRQLLVIDSFVPLPVLGAGYPRARALLNAAASLGWSVTLFRLDQDEPDPVAIRATLSPGIEVCGGGGIASLAGFLQQRRGAWDTVLVSRPDNMRAVLAALDGLPDPFAGARLIYDAEALASPRAAQMAQQRGMPLSPAAQQALLEAELALARRADAVIAVTGAEAESFRTAGRPVTVLSHPVTLRRPVPPFAARSGLMFAGRLMEADSPNYEGMAWFVRVVWPRIRAGLGDVELRVAGLLRNDPAELQGPGILLLGPVPELGPLYDSSRLFVAPTLAAAGVAIKVLEAGAAGLPVLTTPLIAGQLGWTAGQEAAVADDPEAMADLAIATYRDQAQWTRLRDAAGRRLARDHGASRFRRQLAKVLRG